MDIQVATRWDIGGFRTATVLCVKKGTFVYEEAEIEINVAYVSQLDFLEAFEQKFLKH